MRWVLYTPPRLLTLQNRPNEISPNADRDNSARLERTHLRSSSMLLSGSLHLTAKGGGGENKSESHHHFKGD